MHLIGRAETAEHPAAPGPTGSRVWKIRTLKEHVRVFVDEKGTLGCDHRVSFPGLPVLRLHYKMFRA